MPTPYPDSQSTTFTATIRLTLLCALLLAEAMAISLIYDVRPLVDSSRAGGFWWLGFGGHAAKVIAVFAIAFLLALGPRLRLHYLAYLRAAAAHPLRRGLIVHLVAFAGFLVLTEVLLGDADGTPVPAWLPPLWLLALIAVTITWSAAAAPIRFWLSVARNENLTLMVAGVVALAAWAVGMASQELWSPLAGLTFQVSAWGLQLFYPSVVMDSAEFLLGTEDFQVLIGAACSGYEGMGLVLIFTALYLSVFRHEFRFPQALLLFPIGLATIWLFNAARIVALIAIGQELSPAIAVEGFHSQAGWISFVCVIGGLLLAAHRMACFSLDSAGPKRTGTRLNANVAMLAPLVVLLATTLLTSALAATVDWLYPLRVLAVAGMLLVCWRWLELPSLWPSPMAVVAGSVVFLVWLGLVSGDPGADQKMASALAGAPPLLVLAWLAFRVLGAALTVPLAEELAFRGYLMSKLAGRRQADAAPLSFSWLAFVVPAVLFGLMHSAWLAGIVAGLVYGALRFRGGLRDAVVAHGITNLLLSIYVLATGAWSLW